MQAAMATIFGSPLAVSRRQKARMAGLYRIADTVARKRAERT